MYVYCFFALDSAGVDRPLKNIYNTQKMSSSPPPRQRRRRNRSRHARSDSGASRLDPTAPVFTNGRSSEEQSSEQSGSPSPPAIPLGSSPGMGPTCTEKFETAADTSLFRERTKGTEYVLAWDIEKSGPRTDKHSMLAIGAVVLRVEDDERLAEIRLFMKMEEGHDFSEICREEYWFNWDKFPNNKKVLELIEKEGVHPREGITKFAAWLDSQESRFGKKVAITTDNPASDAAWVSHYFEKYLERNPMFHPFGDERRYRRLHHSNAYARCLSLDDGSGGNWQQRLRDMGVEVPPEDLHDHDPLNDATWIAKLYTACIRYVRKQRYPCDQWRFPEEDRQQARQAQQAPPHPVVYYHPQQPLPMQMRILRNADVPPVPQLEQPQSRSSFVPFWQREMDRQQEACARGEDAGNPGQVSMEE